MMLLASRTRRPAALLLALLLLPALSACGEAQLPPEHWLERLGNPDEARREEAVVELGKLGRADPGRIVPLLVAVLERERGQRLTLSLRATPDFRAVLTGEARARILSQVASQLRGRLRLLGRATPQTRIEREHIELLVLPLDGTGDIGAEEQRLLAELARPGTLDLLAELPAPAAVTPERPVSPWGGDAAGYTTWLTSERGRLEAALEAGRRYEPSDAARGVVRRAATPEEPAGEPVPVQLPVSPSFRFTEEDLVIQPRDDPQNGTPSLFVSASAAREADFRAFLRANAGLRLWLVLDDEALLSGRLPGEPGVVAAFPVRAAQLEAARTRAARLTARAALGRYPVPVAFTALERAPVLAPDEPVARALVEVGLPAEAALEALVAKDASWGPLVQRLRADIVRGQTRDRR